MWSRTLAIEEAKRKAAIRFPVAVGISASITIGLPILLVTQLGTQEKVAVAIAMVVAFFVNFLINKTFVFRSTHGAGKQLVLFLLVNFLMRVVDYLGFLLLFSWFGLHYVLSLALILPLTTIVRFFIFARIFSIA